MAHTHIRHKIQPPKRNRIAEIGFIAICGILVLIILALRLRTNFLQRTHESAWATISETRIDTVGSHEAWPSGTVLYLIEVHVQYSVSGELHDRWVPASDVTGDRASLQLLLVDKPKKCLAYWAPHHPDNVRCALK